MQITVFNGSPRGAKSNTKILLEHLMQGYRSETDADVEIEVHYPPAEDERAQVIRFLNHTHADADGIARLRVPYATSSANGDGVVRSARWKCGTQEGELRIDEADVLEGRTLLLP